MASASSTEVDEAMSELMVLEAQLAQRPVELEAPRTPPEEPPLDPQQPDAKRPKTGQTVPWRLPPRHTEPPGPPVDPRGSRATLQKPRPQASSKPLGKPLAIQIGEGTKAKPAVDKAVAVGNVAKPEPGNEQLSHRDLNCSQHV